MAKQTLDDLVTPKPASWSLDFRVPKIPSLRDAVSGKTLLEGLASHDQAIEKWRQDMERSIADRLAQSSSTSTAATATTTPAETSATSTPAAASSSSSATKASTISTTDDLPEGLVNFYLSDLHFTDAFARLGFNPNYLAPAITWYVPPQKNVVITGPFTVDGVLNVDGYMAFLDSADDAQDPVSGSFPLGNGVSNGTVPLALAFQPRRVVLSVSRPSGALMIFACVNAGTLTTAGFDFELSGLTDSALYVLDYTIFP